MANFFSREDIESLKAYVQGPDSGFANKLESTVLLTISHSNLKARFMEIRLDKHVSVKHANVVHPAAPTTAVPRPRQRHKLYYIALQ